MKKLTDLENSSGKLLIKVDIKEIYERVSYIFDLYRPFVGNNLPKLG